MRTPVRLSLYVAVLLALFAGSYAVAGVAVPDEVVEEWHRSTESADTHTEESPETEHDGGH